MNATMSGAIRSKINWLGLAVLVLGTLQTQQDVFSQFLPPKWLGLVNMLVGVSIVVARFFTTQSLAEKGTKDVDDTHSAGA